MSIGELKTVFIGRVEKILAKIQADRCKNIPRERKLSPVEISLL
jgi:hypothetical protein